MLSLAFIVVFIFCLATAVAAILLSHQLLATYNTSFHKFYFYYLVAFYAFSIYGIWGQILIRVLLAAQELQISIIENVANFLPVLGVPFLFVSWLMLVNMTYSLYGARVQTTWSIVHVVLLLAVCAGSWLIYNLLTANPNLKDSFLKYAEMAILILFELFYFIVVGIVFLNLFRRHFLKGASYLGRYWMMLNAGVLIRAGCLVMATVNDGLLMLAIFMYFGSNFVPLVYMLYIADHVFEPVKASGTDSAKIKFIIRKYGITKREKEIIMQICDGKTNQEIADDLFISLQTVKDHTHRIYAKIGIKSRMQLVQKLNA